MDRNDLLIECPACRKKISTRAKKCPQCDTELKFAEQPDGDKTTQQQSAFSQENILSNKNDSVIHFDFTKSTNNSKNNLLKKVVWAVSMIIFVSVLIAILKLH